ncbi:unnamed protein product [Pedinophyceae sp. YPF-701]|nr:unnamed protein product [Pedinophyceae sp. YPF-701]
MPTDAERQRMARLGHLIDDFERKIELERKRIEDLEAEMSKTQSRAKQDRGRMPGTSAVTDLNLTLTRRVKQMEDRLEKCTVDFNKAVAVNKKLREEINALRKDRRRYREIYLRLERDLQERKGKVDSSKDSADLSRESRDNAQSLAARLRSDQDERRRAFESEMNRMNTRIEYVKSVLEMERQKQLAVTEAVKKEAHLASSWNKLGGATAKAMTSKALLYERAFEAMREALGIETAEDIVGQFVAREERNMRLFLEHQVLQEEIERLRDHTEAVERQRNQLRGEQRQVAEERRNMVRAVTERVDKLAGKSVKMVELAGSHTARMDALKERLQAAYKALDCRLPLGGPEDEERVRSEGGVLESDILPMLSAIEAKADEVLAVFMQVKKRAGLLRRRDGPDAAPAVGGAITVHDFRPPRPSGDAGDDDDMPGTYAPSSLADTNAFSSLMGDLDDGRGPLSSEVSGNEVPMLEGDIERMRLKSREAANARTSLPFGDEEPGSTGKSKRNLLGRVGSNVSVRSGGGGGLSRQTSRMPSRMASRAVSRAGSVKGSRDVSRSASRAVLDPNKQGVNFSSEVAAKLTRHQSRKVS